MSKRKWFSAFSPASIILFITVIVFSMMLNTEGMAAGPYYSRATGDWTTNTTWSLSSGGGAVGAGIYPLAGEIVYLDNGFNVTVSDARACASLTFTGASATLTVDGTLTLTGAIILNSAATSTAGNIGGTGSILCSALNVGTNFDPSGTPRSTVINSTVSSISISGNLALYSNRVAAGGGRINNATINLSSGTMIVNGSVTSSNEDAANTSSLIMGNSNPTLKLSGATPFSLSGTGANTITLNGTGASVYYDYAGTQSIYATITASTYTNLYIATSGIKTLSAAITVSNNMDISTTSTTTLASDIYNITGSAGTGTFTMASGTTLTLGNTGVATATLFPSNYTNARMTLNANSTVVYQANVAQTVSVEPTYGNLTLAQSGIKTLAAGNCTIAGALEINAGITMAYNSAATRTVTVAGSLNATGGSVGTIDMSTGVSLVHILNLGGASNALSALTTDADASVVNYNKAGDQQIFGSANYRTLTLSNTGIKTLQGNVTLPYDMAVGANITLKINGKTVTTSGNTTIAASGTLDIDANSQFLVADTKSITNSGTLKIVGTSGNPAIVSRNTSGNYSITQSAVGATFHALYYQINYLNSSGVSITDGNLDATNNLSQGSFSNGAAGGQSIDLTGLNCGDISINGIVFNAGPTYNIKRTSGTGVLTVSGSGALSGEANDWDNANPGTLILWATTYYAKFSGAWSQNTTWSTAACGGADALTAPGATDNVVICGGYTVTIDIANAACNNLTLGNDATNVTCQITAAGNVLTVNGDLKINTGSNNNNYILDAGPGTINVNGSFSVWNTSTATNSIRVSTGILNIAPAVNVDNANKDITIRDAGIINFNGLITQTAGAIANTTTAGSINFNAGYTHNNGAFTTMAGETINFLGDFSNTTGALTFNATSSAIFKTTAAINILPTAAITFGNLNINTGVNLTIGSAVAVISVVGTTTIDGGLIYNNTSVNTVTLTGSLSGAGTIDMSGGGLLHLLNLGGATNVIGTYTLAASATVTYSRAGDQTVFPSSNYGNVTISGSGIKTLDAGNFATAGKLKVSAGTFDLGTTATTISVGGTAAVTGTLNYGNTVAQTVSIGGNLSGAGTINMSGGNLLHVLNLRGAINTIATLTATTVATEVNYNMAGDQQVFSTANYRKLTTTNSGIKTLQGNITVANDITVGAGTTLTINGKTATTSGNTTIAATGTLDINANGTSGQFQLANGMSINNSGILKIVGTLALPSIVTRNIAGNYTINQSAATATFHASYFQIYYTGTTGVSITDGSIDATNNFSNGIFDFGSGTQYLYLTGLNFSNFYVGNTTFNTGPTYNVTRTSGAGSIIFTGSSGTFGGTVNGEANDNDPLNLVNWNPITYFAKITGDWDVPGNWVTDVCGGSTVPASAPDATKDVVICSGITIYVNSNFACNNLTLSNGNLEWTNQSKSVTVNGDLYVNGVIDATTGYLHGTECNGADVTVSGNCTFVNGSYFPKPGGSGGALSIAGNLTCDGANYFTDGASNSNQSVTIGGTMSINSGTTSIGGSNFTVTGATSIAGTLVFAASSTGDKIFNNDISINGGTWNNSVGEGIEINGNLANNGSWIGCTGGTCTYTMGVIAGTYTISGAAIAMSIMSIGNAATIINNSGILFLDGTGPNVLTGVAAGCVFNNTATGYLYLECAGVNVGTITFNASTAGNTVYYDYAGDPLNAATNQVVKVPSDGCYGNLVIATSGIKTISGNTGINGTLTIQNAAILSVSTWRLTNCSSPASTANLTMLGTSELRYAVLGTTASVPEFTGTYDLLAGTITLNGVAQTLSPGDYYNNLSFSGTGAVTMTGVTNVHGDISISNAATITGTSFTMECDKTFEYNSTGNSTLTNNIGVGNFIHKNTGDINDGGYNITVCGSTFSKLAPSLTADFVPSGTGRVTFNPSSGSCAVTSSAAANIFQFKNVTINANKTLVGDVNGMNIGFGGSADWTNNGTAFTHNSGTVTVVGNITIAGTTTTSFNHLTISSGILTGHATEMIVEGNWTNNVAAGFTHNSGLVTFTGGNAQSLAGTQTTTFNKLTINKTAATTLTQTVATAIVNSRLTITEGVFNVGINTLNGTGDFYATGGDLQLAKLTTVPELTGATYSVAANSMVTLNGGGGQTLNCSVATGGNTYYNLLFSTSGVKNISGLININGDVTVSGSATLTNNSAFIQAPAKTFYYNSTAGTTTLTAATNVIIGNYSQAGAGTLNINSNNFTVRGATWNKTNGTFTNSGTVIFQGALGAQSFTETAATTFNIVSIDNSSGLTLVNDISISNNLSFSDGVITTNARNVILTAIGTTLTGAATGKFVHGNLKKAIAAGVSSRTFEVGTVDGINKNYTPIDFSFNAATTAGNLTCASTAGDHTNILSSDINPSKSVNRFWTVANNTIGTLNYDAVFNFIDGSPADRDAVATWANFVVYRYDGSVWNATTAGTPNQANTGIISVSTPSSGNTEYFQIGEQYIPSSILWNAKNAATAASFNWSDQATWIQDMAGSVETWYDADKKKVRCVGTCLFQTGAIPLHVGDKIMFQSIPGSEIGTVASVDGESVFTLVSDAPAANIEAYGKQKVPDSNDKVNIGNPYISGNPVTIIVDAPANALKVTFASIAQGNTLQHNSGMGLTIATNMSLNQPSNGNTNAWKINDGSGSVSGNVSIGSADATAGRISNIAITSGGSLSISTNLIYSTSTAANAVLNMTGGDGTVSLAGALILNTAGTLIMDNEDIFNYNGTTSQTVTIGSSLVYRNLYISNSTNGVTLGNNITNANVTGNLVVQSGGALLYSGGYNIGGNATKTFNVQNGSTFRMTGISTFPNNPTSFNTYTFGATSNTQYWQTNAQNISVQTYGNLAVQPVTDAVIHTFQTGTTAVAGSLVLGNGTNAVTVNTVAGAAIIDIAGSTSISTLTTFDISNSTSSPVITSAGDWTNNGGTFTSTGKTVTFDGAGAQLLNGSAASQIFNNVIIDKSGSTLSCGVTPTSLTVNNLTTNATNTSAFTAPASLTINGILTHAAGTINSGANIYIKGDWTITTGAAFGGGTGTVTFNSAAAGQIINGTLPTKAFNNIVVDKAGQILSTAGGTATITAANYTLTAGTFTAPAIVTVGGNWLISAGVYTAGANTNVAGNVTINGGTFTPGSNTITLNGNSAQRLRGPSWPTLYNLTVNNSFASTAVTLDTSITVDRVFTLTNGHVVTTTTDILTLTDNATVVLNAPVSQDNSFVKGPMSYIEDDNGVAATKVFPVGKGSLMHELELNIKHSGVGTNTYTAIYYLAADAEFHDIDDWILPLDGTLDGVSGVGHWGLIKDGAVTISNGSVKLYYLSSDRVSVPADLRVAKGDHDAWANIGGSGTASPAGTITSATNFTSGLLRVSLSNKVGGGNSLPITLLSYDAKVVGSKVRNVWTTVNEKNNAFFTIEKSLDGNVYEYVGMTSGGGYSNSLIDYELIDATPYYGLSYYRLMQTDFDGASVFFNPVAVNYVVPVEGFDYSMFTSLKNVYITMQGVSETEGIHIVINDMMGRVVYAKDYSMKNNNKLVVIDVSKWTLGTYIINVSCSNKLISKKILLNQY